jgi:cation diffusion facilitator family transporter
MSINTTQTSETEIELKEKKKITVIGAVVNLVLSILKVVFGWIGQSHALVADGIHSISDLLTDALVYFAAHHGSQDADEDHPYGHARFETLATVILGAILVAVAGAIIWDAIVRVLDDEVLLKPSWIVLVVAAVSILSKEVLFHQTLKIAEKTNSTLMKANAWHHRSDAISSLIVLVGVGIEMAGYHYFDAIAALIVGLMVAKIGFELVNDASKELVDTALEPELIDDVKKTILRVNGVRELHFLRTRRMGGKALVDVHIIVEPRISVSEGHIISETVRQALLRNIDNISEVMVHIDPEDDELVSPSIDLPLRDELLLSLDKVWLEINEKDQIKHIHLHYLEGQIELEIELPSALFESTDNIELVANKLIEQSLKVPEVSTARVTFSL